MKSGFLILTGTNSTRYTVKSRYLKVKVHSQLLIPQSKFSGPKNYFKISEFELYRKIRDVSNMAFFLI